MAKEKIKLIPLSRVRPKSDPELDSVAREKSRGSRRTFDILMQAQLYWNNMSRFRKERERNKRYTYGDQWGDIITVDNKPMTEEEYIKTQGNAPLKNNVIRHTVRSILGLYRGQATEPICTARDRDEQSLGETMSAALQCNMQRNQMDEVYARTMEEFLISGLVVHKKWYGRGIHNGGVDCWTSVVEPNNFFIDNNMRDFRGWDVSMLGQVGDMTFNELCSRFAEGPEDDRRLKEIYSSAQNQIALANCAIEFGYSRPENYDFLSPAQPGLCRVIEVWRKETKPRYLCHDYNTGDIYKIEIGDYEDMVEAENNDRLMRGTALGMPPDDIPLITAKWIQDTYWYYYYLSPFGDVLQEGETPYEHKSHPYVFKAYPYIDGEIHSYVGDIIDQQRYVNRLITMYDWIMRASSKGLLLFPEDSLPDGYTWDDIASEWSKFNGMIIYKPRPDGKIPQQVANNSTNIGITELLNLQLKLVEEISGVNGALQGKTGYAGTSAALYNQQTNNAATSLLDILKTFGTFVIDAAYKDVKNIQQFYDDKRMVNIVGKTAQLEYDPRTIRNVEFDLSITESTATATYRQRANEILMQLWQAQAISVEMLLEHADLPYADELLQSIRSQKEQVEQGQMPDGISPQLQQQVQQSANQDTVNRLYQGITAPENSNAA